jgi:hypothetical protein
MILAGCASLISELMQEIFGIPTAQHPRSYVPLHAIDLGEIPSRQASRTPRSSVMS